MKKRLLSLMLTCCMVLTLLPIQALAYTEQSEDDADSDSIVVTSAADLNRVLSELSQDDPVYIHYQHEEGESFLIDRDVTVPDNVTLDLFWSDVSCDSSGRDALVIQDGCTFTNYGEIYVSDITVTSGGKLVNANTISSSGKLTVAGTADLQADSFIQFEPMLTDQEYTISCTGTITCAGTIEIQADLDNGIHDQIKVTDDEPASLTVTEGGTIRWGYSAYNPDTLNQMLTDLKNRQQSAKNWPQTAEILFVQLTLTEDLVVPEGVWLHAVGEGWLTISEGCTLTTNDVVFIEDSSRVDIYGTWISNQTIVVDDRSNPALYLFETGSYTGTCIQVNKPYNDPLREPWDCLSGFSRDMFDDEIEEDDIAWYLFSIGSSGGTGDDKPHEHTPDGVTDCTKQSVCTSCGEVLRKAGSHTSDGVTDCTKQSVCTSCGEVLRKAGSHTSDGVKDCTKQSVCTSCGEVLRKAGSHTSDCVKDCTKQSVCTSCGEVLRKAGSHTSDGVKDCTKKSACTVCKMTLRPAGSHTWNNGKVTTIATCKKTGVKTYTCTTCSATKTEIIAKTSHAYTDKVTAPTCTAKGYTTHKCSACGNSYKDNYLSALGHDYDVQTVTSPTCTEGGYTTYACARCKDSYTSDETAALGHKWVLKVPAAGLQFTCSRCHAERTVTPLEFCDHKFSYAADGATLIETCEKCDHQATATLSISNTAFTGTALSATVTYSKDWAGGTLTPTYKNNVGPGSAWAYLTVGKVQAELKFLISAKTEMSLNSYLNKTAQSGETLKNAKYFDSSKTKKFTADEKQAFVDSLLEVSMQYADPTSYQTVHDRIYDLLFKATYRPLEFGAKLDNLKKWPIQNYYYGEKGYKNIKSAKDNGLGYTVSWKSYCGGCFSYGRFSSVYVYHSEGSKQNNTSTGAVELRTKFRKTLDPGETIYYKTAKNGYNHAIVYLGESADGQGFYFISYGGGKMTASKSYHGIHVGYFSFQNFYKMTKNCSVKLYDTNGGSYYAGTATAVSKISSAGSVKKITAKCPVEMVITLGDECLDSRLLSDGQTASASFGTMTVSGPIGGDRTIELLINDLAQEGVSTDAAATQDYQIQILGTGDGTMDLTVEQTDPARSSTDTRRFLDVPITASTTAVVSTPMPNTDTELIVFSETGDRGGDVWAAGENETVSEPSGTPNYAPDFPEEGDESAEDSTNSSSGSGSGSSSSLTYPITAAGSEHGQITVRPVSAAKGETVTITAVPDAGYELKSLTVTDKNGTAPALTEQNGKYTFTMPAGQVTIQAVFAPCTGETRFEDVPSGAYYAQAVNWAVTEGITSGTSPFTFSPELTCTRGQLVTFLWQIAGRPAAADSTDFTDVAQDAYYAQAIRWAAAKGLVSGYGSGCFGPEDTVTREQVVTILFHYAQSIGLDLPQNSVSLVEFRDCAQISDYAMPAMQWAVRAGILSGYDNCLMPKDDCTRAQIVTILHHLLGQ